MTRSAGWLLSVLLLTVLPTVSTASLYDDYSTVIQVENSWGGLGPLLPFDYLGYGKTDGIGCFREMWSDNGAAFYLFANSGAGIFTKIDTINFNNIPFHVTGDFNGDGYSDLLVRGNQAYGDTDCHTYFRDSTGLGEGVLFLPEYNGNIFDSSDINDDTLCDVCGVTSSRVFLWYSEGSGAYTSEFATDSLGVTYQVRFRDLDNDGDLDLLVILQENSIVLENDGVNVFSPAYSYILPPFTYYSSMSFSDLDGNSFEDIILTNQNEAGETVLIVFLNMGDMSFIVIGSVFDEDSPFLVFCNDLDLDGMPDLSINMNHHMCIFRGNGDGSFESTPSLFESDNFGNVLFHDYDVDGDLDMAAVYHGSEYSYLRIYWNSVISEGVQENPVTEPVRQLTADQNPFSFSVELSVSNISSQATIQVFDLCGRSIVSLATDDQGHAVWNGQDSKGRPAPSGTYLIRVREINCNQLRILKI